MMRFASFITFFLLLSCLQPCLSQKLILVSLDGFRHDYIELALAAGRNVSAFLKITELGFRAMQVQNVMPTQTFPSHYTLVSGRFPESHGIVRNHFWSPVIEQSYRHTSPQKNLDPFWFTEFKNEPIWLTNQRHGFKSGACYWPAQDARIYGQLPYVSFGLYSGSPTIRYRVDRIMDWIAKPDVNFVMMYFPQPDAAGHKWGPNSKGVLDAIEVVNDGIAYLMQRLDSAKEFMSRKPNVIVTSDHGMTRVNFSDVVDVSAVLPLDSYHSGVDGNSALMGVWPKSPYTDGILK